MRISDWSSDVCSSDLRLGTLSGTRWAWLGDGNNVLHSIIEAGSLLHFDVRVGCPAGYDPSIEVLEGALKRGATVQIISDPRKAVAEADVVEIGRASCRATVCQYV